MDRNTTIGLFLMFVLIVFYQWFMMPDQMLLAEQQRVQDSIAVAEKVMDSLAVVTKNEAATQAAAELPDSVRQSQMANKFGAFAALASGQEQVLTLSNEQLELQLTNKGGIIKEAHLKNYDRLLLMENKEEVKAPLNLLDDPKNKFEYILPVSGIPGGSISTADLFFQGSKEGNTAVFKADIGNGSYLEQRYTLTPGDSYNIDYEVRMVSMNGMVDRAATSIPLHRKEYMNKLERNTTYERMYSTVYFKPADDNVDNCSCTSDDEEKSEQAIKWFSHSNQFFNSTLIAETAFKGGEFKVTTLDEADTNLKLIESTLQIPFNQTANESFKIKMYVGPNEFNRLSVYDQSVEDIIPFGWSIFGTINRWIVRPIFNFLSSFIGSMGIVILLLTLIVKGVLYPLTYKMLRSQAKMQALKPQLASLKEKFKEEPQKQQMETMKIYQEYGVNPLGGCMPMLLQMPIWFALYRFFPASIEFRQEPFLWATDLSSFDAAFYLPFDVPFYGDHVSLFTLLWTAATILYTYYNSKHMDFSAQPMMLYMQYMMPVMFLFFFNNYASGLTVYLFFSTVLNIVQTLVTKNVIIDQDKLDKELSDYKKKPKKAGGFSARLQDALKESQKIAAEQKEAKEKKKK